MRTDQPTQDQPQAQDQLKRGLPTTQGLPRRGLPTQAQPTPGLPTQGLPRRGLPTQAPSSQGLPTRSPSPLPVLPPVQEQPTQVMPVPVVAPTLVPPAQAAPQIQTLPEIEDLYEAEALPEVAPLPLIEETPTQALLAEEALTDESNPTENKPEEVESEEVEPEEDSCAECEPKEPQVRIAAPKLKRKEEPKKKKKKKLLNKSQMFAIFWLVVFIVYIPIPISPDPTPDPVPEFLSAFIDVTPKTLNFDNMKIGAPRTTNLTVTNVSEHDVSISPLMTFDSNSASYLTSTLEDCSSGSCVPVNYATKIDIPKGGAHNLTLTVTMTQNIGSVPIAGDLKVTGEVIR